MLERKPVSKALHIGLNGVLSVAVLLSMPTYAQKSKTVGDLLKGIQTDAKRVNLNKRRSSLPTFKKMQKSSAVRARKIKPPSSGKLYYEEGTNEAELEKITDEGIRQLVKLTNRFRRS